MIFCYWESNGVLEETNVKLYGRTLGLFAYSIDTTVEYIMNNRINE